MIGYLAAGNVREALRVHNRHFDHLELSLMLLEDSAKLDEDTPGSELASWATDSGLVLSYSYG